MNFIQNFVLINLFINIVISKAIKDQQGIVGGQETPDGFYTYQVSLQLEDTNVCGGGIIGEQQILTAAHCVMNERGIFRDQYMIAVFGTNDLEKKDSSIFKIPVERMYVPIEYKPEMGLNKKNYRDTGDIAVLKLESSIELEKHPHLSIIELPQLPYSTYANKVAIIAGFGLKTMKLTVLGDGAKHEEGDMTYKMRYAEAKIISNTACDSVMFGTIDQRHLCARVKQGSKDKAEGVCQGDSGSPLVKDGNTVVGILSNSPYGCDESKGAGVYTRITYYIKFIEDALDDHMTKEMRRGIVTSLTGCNKKQEAFITEMNGIID